MAKWLDSKKTLLIFEVGDEVIIHSSKCNFPQGSVDYSYITKKEIMYVVIPNPFMYPDEDPVHLTKDEISLPTGIRIKNFDE